MAQQDEVSGLRDIIRHDEKMDAQALEKLTEAYTTLDRVLSDFGGRDINTAELEPVLALIKDAEACIKSTPTSNRAPGTLSLGLVV